FHYEIDPEGYFISLVSDSLAKQTVVSGGIGTDLDISFEYGEEFDLEKIISLFCEKYYCTAVNSTMKNGKGHFLIEFDIPDEIIEKSMFLQM
ncbi:MAG: hypothetical protein AAB966_02695, partial [Patescibacteria group bacterium]